MGTNIAERLASLVHAGFESYQAQFGLVTRRARARFESRDWTGSQRDARERLGLYRQFSDWVVRELGRELAGREADAALWAEARPAFLELAQKRNDAELALTFFNSSARRILRSVGLDVAAHYTPDDFRRIPPERPDRAVRRYAGGVPLVLLLEQVLRDLPFACAFADLANEARLAAEALAKGLPAGELESLELVPSPFYRNKGAYLVGRIAVAGQQVPVTIALVHPPEGVQVDAVLATASEMSVVFSFTRSYFQVEPECPSALVGFLQQLMPHKPLDELYTAIGYHKHGKTLLYHTLMRHLEAPEARFEIAEGEPGLVMVVFALPSFNVVFKIIRDHFGAPKNTTRAAVIEKYKLVFGHDRVGRLADAHDFENLTFPRSRFSAELVAELQKEAAGTVRFEGDRVTVRHVYSERRVIPLNLYLKTASPEQAREAIVGYGQAIKDLAAANIFTGDMLLKNFGVTRNERVIFYDYDELCLLTECRFRDIPPPRDEADEMAAEPWFSVADGDVFPEEFRHYLVLPGALGEAFLAAHSDLLTVEYWRRMQQLALSGEMADVYPYREERRIGTGRPSSVIGRP
ncbi:MAG TPA: bifunctional isocitrate dehydrogenase kinase/phosphatase [Gemmatimonadales bacterium]|nr:bifunctional isocitrate dehydrogenase kinase/phosphatase [Gemmatimonadales bacterium]